MKKGQISNLDNINPILFKDAIALAFLDLPKCCCNNGCQKF